jgi:acetyl-CoA carboxylase biotin carboxyl carrier protein
MAEPEAPASSSDTRLVRELADVLVETGLTEIEMERGDLKIRVVKQAPVAAPASVYAAPPAAAPAPAPAASAAPAPAAPAAPRGDTIKSPMVGTVYLQAQPGSPPFARPGDTVSEGQTLLLIEAMKTMNPIVAPRAGKIVEILVGDSQPVEYGEPLAIIA